MYTEFMNKKVFELLTLAAPSPARGRQDRQKCRSTSATIRKESNGGTLLKLSSM